MGGYTTNADDTASKQQIGRPFPPGVSGNPKGRPKSARSKLAEDFIKALANDFAQHGTVVIQDVRTEKPVEYLKVCASLVPKTFELSDDDGVFAESMGQIELARRLVHMLGEALVQRQATKLIDADPPA